METCLNLIRRDVMQTYVQAKPGLLAFVLSQMARQMRTLEERYTNLEQSDAFSRVVHSFLILATESGLHGRTITLPFVVRRELLAQLAGTTPETVSRIRTRLRNDGLVSWSNGQTVLADVERLRGLLRRAARENATRRERHNQEDR